MDWANKVVLITGASSGIGRGLAVELARRGAKLGLVARRKELLDEIVEEIRSRANQEPNQSANLLAVAADVQDASSLRTAAERLRAEFGRIDVLIANAGIGAANDSAE